MYDREGVEGIDIGFALLPEYEKNGFGFEASNKLKNAAFYEFGIQIISAITTKENVSSQKLLNKLGLELIGATKIQNESEELLLYKLELQLE